MKKKAKQPSILSIELANSPKVNEPNKVIVKGQLPDKAWKLGSIKKEIREKSKKIIITIPATRDPNLMAAQVIVSFNKEIDLQFLSVGKWSIICNNRILEVEVKS